MAAKATRKKGDFTIPGAVIPEDSYGARLPTEEELDAILARLAATWWDVTRISDLVDRLLSRRLRGQLRGRTVSDDDVDRVKRFFAAIAKEYRDVFLFSTDVRQKTLSALESLAYEDRHAERREKRAKTRAKAALTRSEP